MKPSLFCAQIILLTFSPSALAQGAALENQVRKLPAKIEIVSGFGLGHVFRFDDQGFGNGGNLYAGVEVPVWRKLRFGAEVNRTFGLSPRPVQCGGVLSAPGVPLPCTGSARRGVGSLTGASFVGLYYLGNHRLQPYFLGGVSILRSEYFDASSIVHRDYVEFYEQSRRDTGVGLTLGAGLRAVINRHFSLRPELRVSDGTALSSSNLSQLRFSLGLSYGW